jgi:hypothetical protein
MHDTHSATETGAAAAAVLGGLALLALGFLTGPASWVVAGLLGVGCLVLLTSALRRLQGRL